MRNVKTNNHSNGAFESLTQLKFLRHRRIVIKWIQKKTVEIPRYFIFLEGLMSIGSNKQGVPFKHIYVCFKCHEISASVTFNFIKE